MKYPKYSILLVLLLAGCEPQQAETVAPPPVTPEAARSAPADPVASADPATMPASPAQAPSDASPPSEPSTARPSASADEPAIEAMSRAIPSAKMSVAADVRYSLEGSGIPGQPVTVHLAAIPRVPGTNLKVGVQPDSNLKVAASTLTVQKVEAAGVYRQQWEVTRLAESTNDLRVLVTMDMPEGTAFGFFTIPLDAAQARDGNTAQKTDSVKQR